MKLECPKCNALNQAGVFFCNSCGMRFKPAPKKSGNSVNNSVIAAIVLFSLFSICGLCGIIGSLNNPKQSKTASQPDITSKPESPDKIASFVSDSNSNLQTEANQNTNSQKPETDISKPAVVIFDDADLRATGSKNGQVIESISEGGHKTERRVVFCPLC